MQNKKAERNWQTYTRPVVGEAHNMQYHDFTSQQRYQIVLKFIKVCIYIYIEKGYIKDRRMFDYIKNTKGSSLQKWHISYIRHGRVYEAKTSGILQLHTHNTPWKLTFRKSSSYHGYKQQTPWPSFVCMSSRNSFFFLSLTLHNWAHQALAN